MGEQAEKLKSYHRSLEYHTKVEFRLFSTGNKGFQRLVVRKFYDLS